MVEIPLTVSYREVEVGQIFRRVKAGDSCLIVGASGMAKSNLFRHLLRLNVREHFLGPDWRTYLFAPVDSHALPGVNEASLYESIVRGLLGDVPSRGVLGDDLLSHLQTYHSQLETTLLSAESVISQRIFLSTLEMLAVEPTLRFVLVFDQFDEVYPQLPSRCLSTLRHLRDNLKYRVSFVVFTREELYRLGHGQGDEEFNELLSAGTLWLGPYQVEDARNLIRRVAARYGEPVDETIGNQLIQLTSGHPGLLKAAFQAVSDRRVRLSDADPVDRLLADRDVHTECIKLWKSISSEEQSMLERLTAHPNQSLRADDARDRLMSKQLILKGGSGDLSIFCPLFAGFVDRQRTAQADQPDRERAVEPERPKSALRIEAGTAWVGDHELSLTPNEFKLLEFLWQHRGNVCTRDEIIRHVYPKESSDPDVGIDDNRVDTLVSRLRARIRNAGGDHQSITTVRARRGFRLEDDSLGGSAGTL